MVLITTTHILKRSSRKQITYTYERAAVCKSIPVEVQSSEVFQIGKGMRCDEGDGISG